MNYEEGGVQAQFNAGVASVERLHGLLKDCNDASRMLNTSNILSLYENLMFWFDSVDVLFKEVAPKLKDEDVTKINNKLLALTKINILSYDEKSRTTSLNRTNYPLFKKQLREIEMEIRKLADKKGLLNPNKDNVCEAMGES